MTTKLTDSARWLFLGLLVFAPWAYGCTPPFFRDILTGGLLIVGGLWLVASLLRAQMPRIPLIVAVVVPLLLAHGWFMVYNARAVFDPHFGQFVSLDHPYPGWPSALDKVLAQETMLQLTGMLVALLFICDLATRPIWTWRLIATMALAGGTLIGLGLVQHAMGATMIFWEYDRFLHGYFFATYYYHGNAGTMINLALPPVACLLASAFLDRGNHYQRAIWLSLLVLVVGGAFVNASRAATGISIGLLSACVLICGMFLIFNRRTRTQWNTIPQIIIVVAALACIPFFVGTEKALTRWDQLDEHLNTLNQRLLVYEVTAQMIDEAPSGGLGPGAWQVAFPFYSTPLGDRVKGRWLSAHQDYLQYWVEWGPRAGFLWFVLLGGALVLPIKRFFAKRGWSNIDRLTLAAAWLALVGVALHAMVDFPWQIASLQLYTITALGICWAHRPHPSEGRSSRSEKSHRSSRSRRHRQRRTESAQHPKQEEGANL